MMSFLLGVVSSKNMQQTTGADELGPDLTGIQITSKLIEKRKHVMNDQSA